MRLLLFRLLHRLVTRFPRTIVFLSFFSAAVAGWYGVNNMQMITDQDRLLSEKLEYHHRYMDFVRRFGDLEFLYVVIEGPSEEKMIRFADALAARLRQVEDVKDVFYKFNTSWIKDYALFYAPIEDLRKLRDEIASHESELKDLFSTRSVDEILKKISDGLEQPTASMPKRASTDELQTVLDHLGGTYRDPFQAFADLDKQISDIDQKKEKQYIWSAARKSLLMLVMPAKDYSTLSVIEKPLRRIRDDIWLTSQEFPGVNAGLTGRPALQADEMKTTYDDMNNANLYAFLGVTLLYALFYKGIIRPNLSVITLLAAMGWTYGFVAFTLGHLNLLSIVFALVLIGVGADYGIHIIHRYQDVMKENGDSSKAVWEALYHVGSGILTGSTTTASVFLIALFTDFLGLAEMGYVTGVGIIFCLISMLTTLPALLLTYDRHIRRRRTIPTPLHLVGLRHVSRYPRTMVAVTLIGTLVFLPMAFRVSFDDNLLNLQADGLESVKYEHKLINESEHSTWYCAFLKPNMEEARKTATLLKANPTVAAVDSPADILPEITPEKENLLNSLRALLSPYATVKTTPYYPNSYIRQKLTDRIETIHNQIAQLKELEKQLSAPPPTRTGTTMTSDSAGAIPQEYAELLKNNPGLLPEEVGKNSSKSTGNKKKNRKEDPTSAAKIATMAENEIPAEIPPEYAEWMKQNPNLPLDDPAGAAMPDPRKILEKIKQEMKALDPQLSDKLKQLKELLSGPRETVVKRLQDANRTLLERPRNSLAQLAKLAEPQAPTPDILPREFRTLYVGKDGSLLLMAYPKYDIWQRENMRQFVDEMRKIDPEATGTPIQVYESSRLMREAFGHISFYSFLAVTFLVFLDFLTLRSLFFAMFPLLLGVLWLVEIMGAFQIPLNLANFFGIPILIGIGVDSAVHIYHRYLETGDIEKSMYTTGTTLTLTALTTIVGFGSLIFASHKGLSSLGTLMTVGSVTCWFTTVVFLPTLIKGISNNKKGEPHSLPTVETVG